MRIAAFEWLCGGGLHSLSPNDVPMAMLQEGWSMLSTLAHQFSVAGHELVTLLDRRLVTVEHLALLPSIRWQPFELPDGSELSVGSEANPSRRLDNEQTIAAWLSYAVDSDVDLVLIVAPEIDGILQQSVADFSSKGLPILNCSGGFLDRACDKWLTAQCLEAASVPHPFTRLATDIEDLEAASSERWCVKSRLGAGCDEMWIGGYQELRRKVQSLADPSRYIVQPWISGAAYSCSAIVNAQGNATWLPLVTQKFDFIPMGDTSSSLRYRGGNIVDPHSGPKRPQEMFAKLLSALSEKPGEVLGWIGVDLLLLPTGKWVIVEVNPRLTTSILGLSEAAPSNLADAMIAAIEGRESVELAADRWKSIEFVV